MGAEQDKVEDITREGKIMGDKVEIFGDEVEIHSVGWVKEVDKQIYCSSSKEGERM